MFRALLILSFGSLLVECQEHSSLRPIRMVGMTDRAVVEKLEDLLASRNGRGTRKLLHRPCNCNIDHCYWENCADGVFHSGDNARHLQSK